VTLLLGARRLGVFDRVYDATRLYYQPESDSPREDVERAFDRVERVLARDRRKRAPGETPRQYFADVANADGRHRRLLDLHEKASYADRVTREEADEAIEIADALVREQLPILG
jgi:hypothetical protein